MKINNLNEKKLREIMKEKRVILTRKAQALGIATAIIVTSTFPNFVEAKDNNTCDGTQIISECNKDGINFCISKDDENVIIIKESSGKYSKEFKIDKNGKATLLEKEPSGFLGLGSKTKTSNFKIKNSTGDRLDINIEDLKDEKIAKFLDKYTDYIDSRSFKGENCLKKMCCDLNVENANDVTNAATLQGSAAGFALYYYLIANNPALLSSSAGSVANQTLAPIVRSSIEVLGQSAAEGTAKYLGISEIGAASSIGEASTVVNALGTTEVTTTEAAIALAEADSIISTTSATASIMEETAAVTGGALLAPEALIVVGIVTLTMVPAVILTYYTQTPGSVMQELLPAILKSCPTVSNSMKTIKKNSEDNNPNNDFYQAFIYKGNVYINVTKPLSLNDASKVMANVTYWKRNLLGKFSEEDEKSDLTVYGNNIYTLNAKDAIKAIENIGYGVEAANGRGIKNQPENHAFKGYLYDSSIFDSKTYKLNPTALLTLKNPKSDVVSHKASDLAGTYYWHFHIKGKENLLNDKKNNTHSFFGIPVIVTENDINKYADKKITVNQLENGMLTNSIQSFIDNYGKVKKLKK